MSKEHLLVSLTEVLENLPSGVAKVVQREGHIPQSGTGRYSGMNMVRRLRDERKSSNTETLSQTPSDRKEG